MRTKIIVQDHAHNLPNLNQPYSKSSPQKITKYMKMAATIAYISVNHFNPISLHNGHFKIYI